MRGSNWVRAVEDHIDGGGIVATVSEMPVHERRLHEDEDLTRACNMTGSIRWLEMYRSYLLAERLDKANPEEHKEIIDAWGRAMGITPGTLASHLRWARAIHLEDLLAVFAEEGIGEAEWTARVGTSHLKLIGRAKDQGTGWTMEFTSLERAAWVRRAYHMNLSVAELEDMLRDHDLLPPKKGMQIAPSKLPNSAADLLELITAAVRQRDMALCITKTGSTRIAPALRRLADMLDREQPGAEFTIGGEGSNNAVHKGACNVLGRGSAGEETRHAGET